MTALFTESILRERRCYLATILNAGHQWQNAGYKWQNAHHLCQNAGYQWQMHVTSGKMQITCARM